MAISNSVSSSNKLVYDDVVGVILSDDMRRKSLGESISSTMLTVENRGRQNERGRIPSKGRSNSKGKSNIEC